MENLSVGTLVIKAMEGIRAAVKEIESIGENRKSDTTHFINASYNMGKYHAYMEILEDLDTEQFVKCYERCKPDCDKVLQGMEKLYDMTGAR